MNNLQVRVRKLRKNLTEQERKFWNIVRNKQFYGLRFLRQYVIKPYIVDFICREKKIIVEIDGGQHNEHIEVEYDKKRTNYLNTLGYKVIRFWNNEIDSNIEGVYKKLQKEFEIL